MASQSSQSHSHTDSPSQAITARHLCMAADVESYSRRHTPSQAAVQADLVRVLEEAAAFSGLNHTAWSRQPQGDQEFAVLPVDTPEAVVLGVFVRHLSKLLGERNANRAESDRMRLRLAIDFGVAPTAALGYSGPTAVAVARYLNAAPLKRVLNAIDTTDLAVMVSDRLYQDVVRSCGEGLDPEHYVKVHIEEKEFSGYGWVYVPEHGPEELRPLVIDPEPEADDTAAAPPAPTHHVGRIDGGVVHFGTGDAATTMYKNR
ncbi:hypothetical protein ABZ553_20770 [Streptomyces sparsogenes]|uniref:hypothetical protein n=1 Tax=Streptomyces sparsogenes TaxID=67365 RepID=UPI0033F1724C